MVEQYLDTNKWKEVLDNVDTKKNAQQEVTVRPLSKTTYAPFDNLPKFEQKVHDNMVAFQNVLAADVAKMRAAGEKVVTEDKNYGKTK